MYPGVSFSCGNLSKGGKYGMGSLGAKSASRLGGKYWVILHPHLVQENLFLWASKYTLQWYHQTLEFSNEAADPKFNLHDRRTNADLPVHVHRSQVYLVPQI